MYNDAVGGILTQVQHWETCVTRFASLRCWCAISSSCLYNEAKDDTQLENFQKEWSGSSFHFDSLILLLAITLNASISLHHSQEVICLRVDWTIKLPSD